MKKLLNTLYVTTSDRYLSLDGENVVISAEGECIGRVRFIILILLLLSGIQERVLLLWASVQNTA